MAKNLFVTQNAYDRADALRRKYGCTLQHAVDTLVRGWDMLSEDQQRKALEVPSEPAAKPRRRPQPAAA